MSYAIVGFGIRHSVAVYASTVLEAAAAQTDP